MKKGNKNKNWNRNKIKYIVYKWKKTGLCKTPLGFSVKRNEMLQTYRNPIE